MSYNLIEFIMVLVLLLYLASPLIKLYIMFLLPYISLLLNDQDKQGEYSVMCGIGNILALKGGTNHKKKGMLPLVSLL